MFKDFKTFDEQHREFRVDAFNALNRRSFGQPGNGRTNRGANSVSLSGPGRTQDNTMDARFLQLSGKGVF
jgi:hypothetical protein